jgi:hypothetical protein
MTELHNTIMGRKLIEHDIPEIAKQLKRIADILEKQKIKELMELYPNDQDLGKKIREHYTIMK